MRARDRILDREVTRGPVFTNRRERRAARACARLLALRLRDERPDVFRCSCPARRPGMADENEAGCSQRACDLPHESLQRLCVARDSRSLAAAVGVRILLPTFGLPPLEHRVELRPLLRRQRGGAYGTTSGCVFRQICARPVRPARPAARPTLMSAVPSLMSSPPSVELVQLVLRRPRVGQRGLENVVDILRLLVRNPQLRPRFRRLPPRLAVLVLFLTGLFTAGIGLLTCRLAVLTGQKSGRDGGPGTPRRLPETKRFDLP